jgi:hypothetical protein
VADSIAQVPALSASDKTAFREDSGAFRGRFGDTPLFSWRLRDNSARLPVLVLDSFRKRRVMKRRRMWLRLKRSSVNCLTRPRGIPEIPSVAQRSREVSFTPVFCRLTSLVIWPIMKWPETT